MIHTRPYNDRPYARYVADQVKVTLILKRMDRQDAIKQLTDAYSYSTVQLPE